ncbi:LacI family DNA-binding transcriptional regulator [Paenibacillus sp. Marseille-Q4541]|uniref:LacI family DNA-binding transcriptional regulator n=1 Tax=Paenibacillus sp. Marseille-Q4541 TaxID=2831522 RepID=UPI002019E9FB|nr:LacI family DNA-binding transcriptional regulator [Paenibacillus sp. Marseille-Q4541]
MEMSGFTIATRKEVAELAGVSEATVSRVLNGVGPMKEETRAKVLFAAGKLGYVPSALARSFAKNRSGNLGVVLPYIPKARLFSSYYFSEMLSGIGSIVREHGYDLLLLFRSEQEQQEYESFFRAQKVDALIILGSRDEPGEREAIRKLQDAKYPFLVVNQHFEGESFPEVDVDHEEGSRQAVNHLIRQGCNRIGFLNGPLSYSNSVDRLSGYQKALEQGGHDLTPTYLFEGNFSRRSGYEAAEKMIEHLTEMDGLFVANDRMAIGVLQKFREQHIPEVNYPKIVAYDDSDAAEITVPPLSSVRVPFYEMGTIAARKLLQICDDAVQTNKWFDDPVRELLQAELIVRASSDGTRV